LVQGIPVGGEWGEAVLMATEHSPPAKRGLYGSLVQIGFPLGMALGTASFFALASLGEQQFMSWGWRVPFITSAVLVVIGIFIRLRIDETPDFNVSCAKAMLRAYRFWTPYCITPRIS
jgi:MFS transporter, MHS family, shikimate and dehydroshikimate transport protein